MVIKHRHSGVDIVLWKNLYFVISLYILASNVVQRVFLKLECENYFPRTFEDTVSYLVYLKATEPRRDF